MISIVVPIYKVEKYLRECLDSIIRQTFKDWECILVDDGSPDACPQIADEYAQRDPRFRVIHQENSGVAAARWNGVRQAQGEWIMFVDSDDTMPEGAIATLYAEAQTEKYDVVVGNAQTPFYTTFPFAQLPADRYAQEVAQDRVFVLGTVWAHLYRRELLTNDVLNISRELTYSEDNVTNLRYALSMQRPARFVDEIVYAYRLVSTSIMHVNPLHPDKSQTLHRFLLGSVPEERKSEFELPLLRYRMHIVELMSFQRPRIALTASNTEFVRELLSDARRLGYPISRWWRWRYLSSSPLVRFVADRYLFLRTLIWKIKSKLCPTHR